MDAPSPLLSTWELVHPGTELLEEWPPQTGCTHDKAEGVFCIAAFRSQNVTCCKAVVSFRKLQRRHFTAGEGLAHSNQFYSLIAQKGLNHFHGSFESWVNWDSEIFLSKLPKPASFIWFPSPPRFLSKISSIKLLQGNVSILSAFAMYGQIQHTHPAHKNLIIHISKRDIKRHNLICSHWKNHELHIPEHRIFNNPNYWSCLH